MMATQDKDADLSPDEQRRLMQIKRAHSGPSSAVKHGPAPKSSSDLSRVEQEMSKKK